MPEEVLAFRRDLFPDLPADGLILDTDLLSPILDQAEFIDRDWAEQDPSYKQIIPLLKIIVSLAPTPRSLVTSRPMLLLPTTTLLRCRTLNTR